MSLVCCKGFLMTGPTAAHLQCPVLASLLIAATIYQTKAACRQVHMKSHFEGTAQCGKEVTTSEMSGGWSHPSPHSGSTGAQLLFLLCIQPRTSAHRMVSLTFPTSIDPT